MVECTGLENQQAARSRGFESHPLCHQRAGPAKRGKPLILGIEFEHGSTRSKHLRTERAREQSNRDNPTQSPLKRLTMVRQDELWKVTSGANSAYSID